MFFAIAIAVNTPMWLSKPNTGTALMTTVIDTIQKITKADTFDEAWLALCQGAEKLEVIIGSYGFGFLEQTRVPNIEDPVSLLPIDGVGIQNYGHDFQEFYDQGEFFHFDTTTHWVCKQQRPALWTETDRPVANGDLEGKFSELYHGARDFGMLNGVAIPLRKRASAAVGGMVIITDNELKSEQADRLLTERLPALQQLAEAFHLYRPAFDLSQARIGLSKREIECLQYLCHGLGQKQIAHRLNTHDRTVQKQITSAKKKLNATSMTQAVVKALAYELIEP